MEKPFLQKKRLHKKLKGECKMEKNILKKKELPEYYDTMYLDGFTPEEILEARRNSMHKELLDQEEENVVINVEVKKK